MSRRHGVRDGRVGIDRGIGTRGRRPATPRATPSRAAPAVGVVGGIAGVGAGAAGGVVDAVGLGVFGFVVRATAVASHIAADALTPAGVRPFAPYRTRHHTYDVARASNVVANFGILAIGGVVALVAFAAGNALANVIG